MATDGDGAGATGDEQVEVETTEEFGGVIQAGADEATPYFVEIWNDYDPSQRFTAIFPVGEAEGAQASSVAYYILEPAKHTGLHADNAEEIIFVAEGLGELFMAGTTKKMEAGTFHVVPAGLEHDIYANGRGDLRLLSFFPTPEALSTFQQVVYPMGGNVVSSKPPKPMVQELDPNNLPENFPFSLADLGMEAEEDAPEAEATEPAQESSVMRALKGSGPDEGDAGPKE